MAREIKIKVKQQDGNLGFTKVQFPANEKVEALENQLKNPAFKFPGDENKKVEIVRETREYELITPLFGGGAETKKADEISVIRATEIRGHLRFWWRATRGGQFSTIGDLKKHEDAIFGSTETNSALQVEIVSKPSGNAFEIDFRRSPLGYIAFPLRDERDAKIFENVKFSVQLTYPNQFANDIKASVWAWEMFGGLGARTRRGFGAIQNKQYSPQNRNVVENDIQSGLSTHLIESNWIDDVPHLAAFVAAKYKITDSQNSIVDAWKYIVDKYQQFRQYRRPTRTSRSSWIEPDEIRRLFLPRKYPKHSIPKTTVKKFPRANFGLPIIFKFKDESLGEPTVTTLEGRNENQKRLASPLIFRTVKCANNQFVGIALILSGIRMPTSGVILKDAPRNPTVQTDLTTAEASSPYVNDILSGNPNVLEAFLATL